ncbi:MAG: hypothetical protein ABR610_15585 [Thermoanaerobaculia bacterium]
MAGGVIGWRVERVGGSELIIAVISDACLDAENAFLSLTIS